MAQYKNSIVFVGDMFPVELIDENQLFGGGLDRGTVVRLADQFAQFNYQGGRYRFTITQNRINLAADGTQILPTEFDLSNLQRCNNLRKSLVAVWEEAGPEYSSVVYGGSYGLCGPKSDKKHELKSEVADLSNKAGKPNWDGEDALALTPETVELALEVIDTFPIGVDKPDVRVTPHGEVSFEWEVNPKVMFSIGVIPSGNVAFVGFFHNSRLRGNEEWNGTLPKLAMCGFEQLREAQIA